MPRTDVVTVAELLGRNPGATPHVPIGPRSLPRQARREPWLTRTNKTSAAITFGSVLAVGTTLAVGSTLLPHRHHADETTTPATTGPVSDSSAITPPEAAPDHPAPAPSGLTAPVPPALDAPPRPTMEGPAIQGPAIHGPAVQGPAIHQPATQGPATQGRVIHGPAATARGSAGIPAQRSAGDYGQGRHAATTPRGPHLDAQGNPSTVGGSSRTGRHREVDRQPSTPYPDTNGPSRSDSSASGHDGSHRSHSGHRGHSDHSGGGLLGGVLGGLSIGSL